MAFGSSSLQNTVVTNQTISASSSLQNIITNFQKRCRKQHDCFVAGETINRSNLLQPLIFAIIYVLYTLGLQISAGLNTASPCFHQLSEMLYDPVSYIWLHDAKALEMLCILPGDKQESLHQIRTGTVVSNAKMSFRGSWCSWCGCVWSVQR